MTRKNLFKMVTAVILGIAIAAMAFMTIALARAYTTKEETQAAVSARIEHIKETGSFVPYKWDFLVDPATGIVYAEITGRARGAGSVVLNKDGSPRTVNSDELEDILMTSAQSHIHDNNILYVSLMFMGNLLIACIAVFIVDKNYDAYLYHDGIYKNKAVTPPF